MQLTIKLLLKTFGAVALMVSANYVQASLIDFTSSDWKASVGSGNTSASVGDVTVSSVGGDLTFNGGAKEASGCAAGQAFHGLACMGDGVGISNDEITEGFSQHIIVTFAKSVDITGIDMLDLFGNESSGETAIVVNGLTSTSFRPAPGNNGVSGGYFATGFSATKVSSLSFYSADDGFSDYALARISTRATPVPEIDGGHAGLALCLLAAFFAVFRERKLR